MLHISSPRIYGVMIWIFQMIKEDEEFGKRKLHGDFMGIESVILKLVCGRCSLTLKIQVLLVMVTLDFPSLNMSFILVVRL